MTVGQIRVQYTKSIGLNGGYMEDNCNVAFDNYKPKAEEYEEVYMCVETGVGSGRLYTFGEHIFLTEGECQAANSARIEKARLEAVAQADYERKRLLAEEDDLRRRLARIEALKLETIPA